jgi:hypothetical protein
MTTVLDKVLRKPIETGLIPGVVALAADDRASFTKVLLDAEQSTAPNQ